MNKKFIVCVKLLCILYLITFLPNVIVNQDQKRFQTKNNTKEILFGIDNFFQQKKRFYPLKKLRLGLLSNHAQNTLLTLFKQNGFNIKPYNNTNDIDVIFFDFKDSGLTHDVGFQTLVKTMKALVKTNKKLIILDRPNPLGTCMEGTGVIPFRHAMTLGEMARFLNKYYLEKPIYLSVIPMKHWKRDRPCSHITDPQFLYSYSFLSILKEIAPIEIKLNKKNMFQSILLPEQRYLSKWETEYLKNICLRLGILGKTDYYYNTDTDKNFKGIKLRVNKSINKFSAFNTILTVSRFLKNRKNIQLSFSKQFDKKLSDASVRYFLKHKMTFDELKEKVESNLKHFYSKSKDCFLYKPFPQTKQVKIIKG
jgi:uncharacterized protein YbbC (DUF1343 family)